MRTKTLLLTAGLIAAGVASSMAQSNVYSLNVVGYVNVTLASGYNLIDNPLDVDGIDNVNVAVTNGTPNQAQLFTWNGTGFNPSVTYYPGNGWYDASFNLATNNVFPGSAFFVYNPGASTQITFVGTVVQSTNSTLITQGYGFYAVVPPIASDLDTNGFPAENQMQYSTFAAGNYTSPYTYYPGNGWYDASFTQQFPTPAVGQGFLIYNPSPNTATTWTQSFTVQ